MPRTYPACIAQLRNRFPSITEPDAFALRRAAMTLTRWHELECGDSNAYCSFAIERDDNGDGRPFMVTHSHQAPYTTTRRPIADREKGAQKRIAAVMARYPNLAAYVQTDPRGNPLYILDRATTPQPYDQFYTRGVALDR